MPHRCMHIRILDGKFMIFFQSLFPAYSALRCVFRCDLCVFRKNGFDPDIALLVAGGGDREMDANEHFGSECGIFHFDRCADPDPV